jgi:hypothetical protein
MSGGDDEGLDVVASTTEDLARAHQNARLVIDQQTDRCSPHLLAGSQIALVGGFGDSRVAAATIAP